MQNNLENNGPDHKPHHSCFWKHRNAKSTKNISLPVLYDNAKFADVVSMLCVREVQTNPIRASKSTVEDPGSPCDSSGIKCDYR